MSAEVGSGHVTIVPVMPGFKATVEKETKSAGASGAKSFEGGFKGAGTRAGKTLGTDLKGSFKVSAGDIGAASITQLNRAVATASAALSRARLKQADESGRVRVAEARLQETIAKYGEGSSQAVAATERLAAARRLQQASTDAVTQASTRLQTAQGALTKVNSKVTSSFSGMRGSVAGGFASLVASARSTATGIASAISGGFRAAQTASAVALTAIIARVVSLVPSAIRASDAIDKFKSTLNFAGLGAAQIEEFTKATQKYADQTVYELADIQSVTAQLAANGVKSFDKLAMAGGNLNAVAGGNADTFRSVGMVLTQTAGAGKLTTENWNQLANAIPGASGKIQKALADAGAYTGNFREAMEKGQISAEEFNAAILALGLTDAAIKAATATNTFEGAAGNLKATITGGLVQAIAPLKPMITGAITAIANVARPFFDWLAAQTGRLATFASGFQGLSSSMSSLLAPLAGIGAAIAAGGLAAWIARLSPAIAGLIPGLGGLARVLGILGGPIGILVAGFGALALSGGDLGGVAAGLTDLVSNVVAALPGVIAQVTSFIPQLVSSLLEQLPSLLTAAVGIVQALVQGLVTAVPLLIQGAVSLVDGLLKAIVANLPMIISGAIQLVAALIEGIVTAVPLLIQGAVSLVTGLLQAIVASLPMIIAGGIKLLMALVEGIVTALPILLTAVVDLVTGLLQAIVANLPTIIQGGIQLLLAIVNGIVTALPILLTAVIDLVMQLLTALIDNLPAIIDAGIQMILALADGLIAALPTLITAAINLVLQLVIGLITMLPKLIEAGIQLVISLITGLVGAIPKIIKMLPQIVMAIWDGLAKVDWAGLGVQIIKGIIDGVISMGKSLLDAIVKLASAAFKGFKDFFGIKSPAKKMVQPGRDVVRGAVAGVDDESSVFGDSLVTMAKSASARAQRSMGTVSAEIQATWTGTDTRRDVTLSDAAAVAPAANSGTVELGEATKAWFERLLQRLAKLLAQHARVLERMEGKR